MSTENTEVDEIKVAGPHKIVTVRNTIISNEDGVEVSRNFYRYTISPGDDYSNEPQAVQDVCAVEHTQEVIDSYIASITPEPLTVEEQREVDRQAAQKRRDDALANMTHTWSDGSVVQVRPTDMPQFQSAIEIGMDQRWVLLDNTTRLTTVAEMQEALNSGLTQGKAIWDQYADELEALV